MGMPTDCWKTWSPRITYILSTRKPNIPLMSASEYLYGISEWCLTKYLSCFPITRNLYLGPRIEMRVPYSNHLVRPSVRPSVCPFRFPHDILKRNGEILMKLACDTWYVSPSLKFDVRQIPCIFNEAAAI
jgi:hypothetical protein